MYGPHRAWSSADGHWGHFRLSRIVNTAALNTGVQISVWCPLLIPLGMSPEVEFLDPTVILWVIF